MDRLKAWFDGLRTSPWVLLLVAASLLAAALPVWPDGAGGRTHMYAYVISWWGGVFQAVSGALVGYWFTRRVLRHNLSNIPDSRDRALVALGVLVFCGLMAVAVTVAI